MAEYQARQLEAVAAMYEAEMKEAERTRGGPGHTAVPDDGGPQGGGNERYTR